MTNSEMDVRGYKPADETYYEYKDEEETPRGVHYEKTQDEDIDASTIGRYAETKDFKHWPFKVGNAMTQNTPENIQHNVDTCLLYTSPSPRDRQKSRMPSSA